jgi:hypothetical protein
MESPSNLSKGRNWSGFHLFFIAQFKAELVNVLGIVIRYPGSSYQPAKDQPHTKNIRRRLKPAKSNPALVAG